MYGRLLLLLLLLVVVVVVVGFVSLVASAFSCCFMPSDFNIFMLRQYDAAISPARLFICYLFHRAVFVTASGARPTAFWAMAHYEMKMLLLLLLSVVFSQDDEVRRTFKRSLEKQGMLM